ncbi:chaplin [Rhizohabitans arisaemae]|uniref:chaplin n=1 Tax=Rhizohabitans arisaemae TaxID=2720610 RepID=UPI0024B0B1B9|nr:chaplin [Rhizohabitans arisaemae]
MSLKRMTALALTAATATLVLASPAAAAAPPHEPPTAHSSVSTRGINVPVHVPVQACGTGLGALLGLGSGAGHCVSR